MKSAKELFASALANCDFPPEGLELLNLKLDCIMEAISLGDYPLRTRK